MKLEEAKQFEQTRDIKRVNALLTAREGWTVIRIFQSISGEGESEPTYVLARK